MALLVLRRYTNLLEAHAAAGALRAAGLNPTVFDETTGSMLPLHQLYLAGYRLAVPEEEASLAAEMLTIEPEAEALDSSDDEEDYEPPRASPRWTGWWTVLGVAMFLTGPPSGFALVLARRKPTPLRIAVLAFFVLLSALFWSAVFTSGERETRPPVVLTPQYPPPAPAPS